MAGETRPDWTDQACLTALQGTGVIEVDGVRISEVQAQALVTKARERDIKTLKILNCEFVGAVNFRQMIVSGNANFFGTTFSGDANFSGTTFSGNANFFGTTFSGNARFSGTTFSGNASFGVTIFSGDADFSGTTFSGYVNFVGTTFSGYANFVDTTFSGDANFSGTTFSGNASFFGTTFSGYANFPHTTFSGDADFSRTTFARHVELPDVGGVVAYGARFERGVRIFVRPGNELAFRAAYFGGSSLVGVRPPDRPDPDELTATESSQSITDLRTADVELLTVSGMDLTDCKFENAHGLSGMGIEGAVKFGKIKWCGWRGRLLPTERRVLAEEKIWRDQDYQDESKKRAKAASIESTYRGLRVGLEKRHETGLAGDFYYGEMEMRKHGAESFAERFLLKTYWAISGYGTRALRALAWFVVLLIACTFAYARYSSLNFDQAALLSLENSVSLLRPPDMPALSDVGPYLVIFQRLFGTLLFGLFLLALRARVKR